MYLSAYGHAIYVHTHIRMHKLNFLIPHIFSLSMEFVTSSKEMSKRAPSPYLLSRCVHPYVDHSTQ